MRNTIDRRFRLSAVNIAILAVAISSSILSAGQIDILKSELSHWIPQTYGLRAPSETIFDSPMPLIADGNNFKTDVGQIIRKFGLHGENVRALLESMDDEIVLGYYNPDTVLVIDRDTTIYANIILVNNAQLIVRDCDFIYKGNIYATSNSRITIEDADFIIPQDYIYQFGFAVMDSAAFEMNRVRFNSANLPTSALIIGKSTFAMDSVNMDGAFITFVLGESGTIDIRESNRSGEFVVTGDSCSLHIAHSDSVLIWLGFPKYSSGEVHGSFGMDDFVESYSFPDSTCSGINYSIELDSLTGLILATMAEDSSEVVVYDADLQSCGNIFSNNWVDTISGLVDGSHYDDFSPHLPGRTLRLVNSSVKAWNLYPYENTEITLQSSIFGELCSDNLAQTRIMNATCDGLGGHIGASGSSSMIVFYSTLFCDALLEQQSLSILMLTSFAMGNLIVKDRAIAVLYNTSLINPIQVYDSATVEEIAIRPPSPACIDDTLSITGTARMLRGPESPLSFEGYRMEYAPVDDTTTFFPLTDIVPTPVYDGELCTFPTYGLDVGEYCIRLWYFFSAYGEYDSISFDNIIYLSYNTGIDERKLPENIGLSAYPNPFNSSVKITVFGIAGSSDFSEGKQCQEMTLKVYDLRGNLIATSCSADRSASLVPLDKGDRNRASAKVSGDSWTDEQSTGGASSEFIWHPDESIKSGIYIVRAMTEDGRTIAKRIVYLK